MSLREELNNRLSTVLMNFDLNKALELSGYIQGLEEMGCELSRIEDRKWEQLTTMILQAQEGN
jgi:hypothetical protein